MVTLYCWKFNIWSKLATFDSNDTLLGYQSLSIYASNEIDEGNVKCDLDTIKSAINI